MYEQELGAALSTMLGLLGIPFLLRFVLVLAAPRADTTQDAKPRMSGFSGSREMMYDYRRCLSDNGRRRVMRRNVDMRNGVWGREGSTWEMLRQAPNHGAWGPDIA